MAMRTTGKACWAKWFSGCGSDGSLKNSLVSFPGTTESISSGRYHPYGFSFSGPSHTISNGHRSGGALAKFHRLSLPWVGQWAVHNPRTKGAWWAGGETCQGGASGYSVDIPSKKWLPRQQPMGCPVMRGGSFESPYLPCICTVRCILTILSKKPVSKFSVIYSLSLIFFLFAMLLRYNRFTAAYNVNVS